MAPRKKLAMITADMLGSLAVHLLTMLVLLCYLLLVLRLDFGNQIGYLLLTVLVGSIVGVSLGALVGAALRIKVEAKRDFDYLEPGLLLPGGTDGGGNQLCHSAERAGGGLAQSGGQDFRRVLLLVLL